jgi:hypothetical protein
MRDITNEANLVAGADHLSPERCQPLVRNGSRLEIAAMANPRPAAPLALVLELSLSLILDAFLAA